MLNATLHDELQRAQDLLDLPYSASSDDIKRAYRRITKRWHPDRYKSGTPAQAEATQMMKQVNEAYRLISDAPLLHLTGPTPSTAYSSERSWHAPTNTDEEALENISLKFGRRIDFWTRFVFGVLFGLVSAFGFWVRTYRYHWWPDLSTGMIIAVSIAIVLACGFGAAYFGDGFWTKD